MQQLDREAGVEEVESELSPPPSSH
jgi:hypothetical protein